MLKKNNNTSNKTRVNCPRTQFSVKPAWLSPGLALLNPSFRALKVDSCVCRFLTAHGCSRADVAWCWGLSLALLTAQHKHEKLSLGSWQEAVRAFRVLHSFSSSARRLAALRLRKLFPLLPRTKRQERGFCRGFGSVDPAALGDGRTECHTESQLCPA